MSDASAPPAAADVLDEYVRAILDGDRRRAFGVVDAARDAGLELDRLYLHVLQPALREVGRLWQENRVSVAEEHLATAITQAAMSRAFEAAFSPPASRGRSLVAACVDAERHEVGLRMLCDLLELEGWDTVYLGASVPVPDLVSMVEARRPDAVALSVAIAPHLPRVGHAVAEIRRRLDEPPLLLVGGRPFLADPGLAESVGADATAEDAGAAVEVLLRRFGGE